MWLVSRYGAIVLLRLLLKAIVVKVQRGCEVNVHRLETFRCPLYFIIFVNFLSSECQLERHFEQDGDLQWRCKNGVYFFFICSSSLHIFDVSGERPVDGDSGVISSLVGISRFTSCLNFASLPTAFSAYCFTKRLPALLRLTIFWGGKRDHR